jgi:hypothetical protein
MLVFWTPSGEAGAVDLTPVTTGGRRFRHMNDVS